MKQRGHGFINTEDRIYMQNYGIDQFMELCRREKLNVIPNHMDYGDDFEFLYGNSMMRAYVVNKLFTMAGMSEVRLIDKGVIF